MLEGAPLKQIIITRSILDAIGSQTGLFGRGTLTILPADTSEEVLSLHAVHHADVIITDLNLPAMGGADLCSAIRSDPALRQVSIIMACEQREETAASGAIKANAFVALPPDPVEIFSTVAELLVIPQRKSLRVLMSATLKGKERESFLAVCQNISISGMLLDTNNRLNAGDQFSCSFMIAHRELSLDCRVVRATAIGKRWQCAAVFVAPDTKSLILIDQYVKSQIGR
jgi:CheY-like chemotaxis protein